MNKKLKQTFIIYGGIFMNIKTNVKVDTKVNTGYVITNDGIRMTYEEWYAMRKAELD
jgi:hypothetical protein